MTPQAVALDIIRLRALADQLIAHVASDPDPDQALSCAFINLMSAARRSLECDDPARVIVRVLVEQEGAEDICGWAKEFEDEEWLNQDEEGSPL